VKLGQLILVQENEESPADIVLLDSATDEINFDESFVSGLPTQVKKRTIESMSSNISLISFFEHLRSGKISQGVDWGFETYFEWHNSFSKLKFKHQRFFRLHEDV